jgi:predicted DNA-binding WGR domain protein
LDATIRRHKLSPAERSLRGQVAIAGRWGNDATEARLQLEELSAARELRAAAERLVAARQAQGLSDRVEDPGTLARIASLLVGSTP